MMKLVVALALLAAAVPQAYAHSKAMPAPSKVNFAIIGDWGGAGGASDNNPGPWKPGPKACPTALNTAFYVSLLGEKAAAGQVATSGDEQCVIDHCKNAADQENCVRVFEQLQAAYLYDHVCAEKKCQFVINTADNFYMNGCNSTSGPWGKDCAGRFKAAYTDVYQTDATPALKGLTWYGSLGNHDVLGYTDGVDLQIAYTKKDPTWYLPARWYAKTVGSGETAINMVVLHTSCFIDGYLTKGSGYDQVDEEQQCSTAAKRTEQLDFAEQALAAAVQKPGWTVIVGHHPPFSGDESYFEDKGPGTAPESAAWARLKQLVLKYQPVVFFSGHDHVIDYQKPSGFETQFVVSGAGSFTEPNDGGWNISSGTVRGIKPAMLYSNVIMNGGKSYTGFVTASVTAEEFEMEFYSINTADKPQYYTTCTRRGGKKNNGYNCTPRPGFQPNYIKAANYPHNVPGY